MYYFILAWNDKDLTAWKNKDLTVIRLLLAET